MKLTLLNKTTGKTRIAPVGISWTTLLFAPIPPILRGDLKWGVIMTLLLWATPIMQIVFADKYNKLYIKDLLQKGYEVTSVEGGDLKDAELKLQIDLNR